MVNTLLFLEYNKTIDKSTDKRIFDSLCSTCEGNKQVKEAKTNLLIQQYELIKMKDDDDIETMFLRFQTLISSLQVMSKSYVAADHVNIILTNLFVKWRPNATTIHEAKDLNNLGLETLISFVKSHEIELLEDGSSRKIKFIALKSK